MAPYLDKAIPFIVEKDAGFTIGEEAEKMLSGIDGRLCVVCCCGPYRTGKSYILSRLMNSFKGEFAQGGTIEACTKGIWIWGRPMERTISTGEKEHIVFLDSEGLGGINQNDNYDTRIFCLSILLSSYLIYNCTGSIDENAINQLSFVCNITKHIHVKSRTPDEEESGEDYEMYFPSFLWLIRDFALQLVDNEGKPITAKQYLESALQDKPGFTEDIMKKNRVRFFLKEFFKDRDCVTLVRPIVDEKKLQNLSKQPADTLRPEFRQQVDALRHTVMHRAQTKIINGKPLNGRMLLNLAREYCQAFSNGTAPVINSAWDTVVTVECQNALAKALSTYTDSMAAATVGKLPMDATELDAIHATCRKTAIALYKAKALGDHTLQYKNKLKDDIRGKYEATMRENETRSADAAKEAMESMYAEVAHKLASNAFENAEAYEDEWERVRSRYLRSVKGPAKTSYLLQFIQDKVIPSVKLFSLHTSLDREKEKARLQEKYEEAKTETVKQSLRNQISVLDLQEQLHRSQKHMAESQGREAVLAEELEKANAALAAESDQLQKIHGSFGENEQGLRGRLEALQRQVLQLEESKRRSEMEHEQAAAQWERERKSLAEAVEKVKRDAEKRKKKAEEDRLALEQEVARLSVMTGGSICSPKGRQGGPDSPAASRSRFSGRTAESIEKSVVNRRSTLTPGAPEVESPSKMGSLVHQDELKAKDKEFAALKRDKSGLDKVLIMKEKALVKLTEQVEALKEQVTSMEQSCRDKDALLRNTLEENKVVSQSVAKLQGTIKLLEGELIRKHNNEVNREVVPQSPDQSLISQDLAQKQREIDAAQKEIKTLERMLRQKEAALEKISAELKLATEMIKGHSWKP